MYTRYVQVPASAPGTPEPVPPKPVPPVGEPPLPLLSPPSPSAVPPEPEPESLAPAAPDSAVAPACPPALVDGSPPCAVGSGSPRDGLPPFSWSPFSLTIQPANPVPATMQNSAIDRAPKVRRMRLNQSLLGFNFITPIP